MEIAATPPISPRQPTTPPPEVTLLPTPQFSSSSQPIRKNRFKCCPSFLITLPSTVIGGVGGGIAAREWSGVLWGGLIGFGIGIIMWIVASCQTHKNDGTGYSSPTDNIDPF